MTAYGVALMVKCATDLEVAGSAPGQDPGEELTRQAELGLDASLGDDLCHAIQEQVETLVNRGEHGRSRSLSSFLHRLRHALDPVRASFHPSDRPDDSERLQPPGQAATGDELRSATETWSESAENIESVVSVAAEPTEPTRSSDSFRTLVLAGLLALALFVQEYVVRSPRQAFVQVDPTSAVASAVPGVRSVDVRWPSAYVTVERSVWRDLGTAERTDWLRQASAQLQSLGYQGALISLEDGTPVALGHSGSELRPIASDVPSPGATSTPTVGTAP